MKSRGKGKNLVVGEWFLSGFLRAITDGIDISREVRQSIEFQYKEKGWILCSMISKNLILMVWRSTQNPVRVIRALRCTQTGKSLSNCKASSRSYPHPMPVLACFVVG